MVANNRFPTALQSGARSRHMQFSPLALEGAELVTLGEAEWLELRLEVDGLGCGRGRQKAQG